MNEYIDNKILEILTEEILIREDIIKAVSKIIGEVNTVNLEKLMVKFTYKYENDENE